MLTGLDLPTLVVLMLAGVGLDWLLGEPRRWHPLVGFGSCAMRVEQHFNRGRLRIACGAAAWLLLVLPPVLAAAWLTRTAAGPVLHVLLLFFCIGLRSLRDHLRPIADALAAGRLPEARTLTARIVSRDTTAAAPDDLAKAAVESTLENGSDAVFGTLFWFLVAGGPGALLHRLANTLDAMWGYRNARFLLFGRFAARADDVLNWLPARLAALSYLVVGDFRRGWRCWRLQARAWSSPNAGPVMAAGAGALGLALGGRAIYEGRIEHRPALGAGRSAEGRDILRAWRLVVRATVLWLALMSFAAGGWHA